MNHSQFTIFFSASLMTSVACHAALVLDTFEQSDFEISYPGNQVAFPSMVISDLVEMRQASINPRRVGTGTASAQVNTNLSLFTMNIDAPVRPTFPVDIILSYSGGDPYNLLGYTGFEFDIVNLSGEGTLVTSLGFSDIVESTFPRTVIQEGTMFVAMENALFGPQSSLASFDFIGFVFEARTEQFSFDLEEIRIVPEPSTVACSSLALIMLFKRRRI
ncbi:MAG: PEP-CTERM sorting domain-containing protein [Verrucomicrobiaceae bacterium]